MTTLRIVFFGTPEIAVPTHERLMGGPHTVTVVVSQPDRGRGRGRKTSASPVSQVAMKAGIPLLRPERVGDPDCIAALEAHAPDLGVVVAFGQFIPKRARQLPRIGYLVNAHASLLPRHRGAAPIAHAILAGDSNTGVSVMRVERQMDAGPVALVRETPIGEDEVAGSLAERLGKLAADAIADVTLEVAAGSVVWTEQDHARATLAPKIGKHDVRLDFRREASFLVRQVRALAPTPGAVTTLKDESLRILAATARAGSASEAPGTLRRDGDGNLRIATADGWLVPTRIQRPGGKPLEVNAFLRGRPIEDGTVLGGEAR